MVQKLVPGAKVVKAFTIYGFENFEGNAYPAYDVKPGTTVAAFHGRGSWTGNDGSLAPSAEGLTTALKIVREVQVSVE